MKYSLYNNNNYIASRVGRNLEYYSHDIDRMINTLCIPNGVYVPNIIKRNASVYSSWEAESRYDLHYSVRIDSIERALTEAENWLIQIKPTYRGKIISVKKKLGLI